MKFRILAIHQMRITAFSYLQLLIIIEIQVYKITWEEHLNIARHVK